MGSGAEDGWYADPWGRWPERWFSAGDPTAWVRNGGIGGSDPVGGYQSPQPPSPPSAPSWAPQPGGRWGQSPDAGWAQSPDAGWAQSPGAGWGQRPGAGWGDGFSYQQPPLPKGGNARTGPLPLHPMSLSDVLDGAFALLRANFRTIALIVLTLVAPLQLISALASRRLLHGENIFSYIHGVSNGSINQTQFSGSTGSLTTYLAGAAQILVLPFAAGAISRVVAASYLGEELTAGPALKAAGRRFLPLLAAWFIVHVLEVIGAILLVVPGLLIMSVSVAVAPAIVAEHLGPIKGLRRSWYLVGGRVWPVMGIALLSGFIGTFVAGVIEAVPQAIGLAVGLSWGWILLFLGAVAGSLISVSLAAVVATLVYVDGRIRKEAFDLQVMADELNR